MQKGVIFLFICISIKVFSQKIYVAKVCDQESRRPLKGVAVSSDTIKTTSNYSGFFQINGDTSKLLTVELEGYEKLSFKFPETDRFVFYLRKKESEMDTQKAKEFYKYVSEQIKYPAEARRTGTQGTSCIYFEVDTLGKIVKSEHISKVGMGCSDQVLRVLKKAPPVWYSIKQNTKFQLRVVFKIQGSLFPIEHLDTKTPEGVILLPEIVVVAYQTTRITPIH